MPLPPFSALASPLRRVSPGTLRLRRLVALGLLLLLGGFLALTGQDHCHEDGRHHREAPVVHILCPDGCAVAPLPEAPALRLPTPLPRPAYAASAPICPREAPRDPEETPPKRQA